MVVIADTSPLNYLILIGEIELIPALYKGVVIPPAVLAELSVPGSPWASAIWAANRPSWLEVRAPTAPIHPGLDEFGAGEREAIALAEESNTAYQVLLLIDENDGRREAQRRSLRTIGTLGILRDAAELGLVDLPDVFGRLQRTSFRAGMALYERVLRDFTAGHR
jgi:predicted nucleic acid-binding protein